MMENSSRIFDEKGSELNLKALRERKGLTLEEVHRVTKISMVNLRAMEEGDFGRLPPPVYTRAYFRAYASLLEEDEKKLLAPYEAYLMGREKQEKELLLSIPQKKPLISQRAIILISLSVLLIIVLFFVVNRSYFKEPELVVPQLTKPEVTKSVLPAPAPAVKVEEKKGLEAEKKGNRLVIIAHEKTWLRIREDEGPPYEVLMKKGEKLERVAGRFVLDVGNAGGITVEFQGKVMSALGKPGEVVHLRLPE